MADDAADAGLCAPLAEALDRLRLVRRRPPHARALREHLHAVAADRLDPVDRGVDPAGRRDVRAEFHRVPTIERRVASASAWLRARPASSTSEACARSSSTGSSRGEHGGEFLLRIENTDTSREVAEAVDQIKESLLWLGIDWDGDVHVPARHRRQGARARASSSSPEGKAYEDEGAIRFRQPKEGTVSWDDAVRGRIEFKNELLADLVIVRSDGRPTYNFVSPVDDMLRRDHARDPRRGPRLEHADADQHPARARRRPAGLRARAEHQRRRRPEALEAPERRRARRLPRRRLPARRR